MKLIKYLELYNYLTAEENLNSFSACQTIARVRNLPADFKNAVLQVLEGLTPHLEYNEVTIEELIDKEQMTPVRAIFMLDWIRREPLLAMRYMEMERHKAPQSVSEADKEKLRIAMERFKQSNETPVKEDTSDISVE